jgi:hypothetical protein
MGITKLIRQLTILDGRIKVGIEREFESIESIAELVLDLETYYTVAADVLDLAGELLPPSELPSFKAAPICKIIRKLRNLKVRHAYNKPDGEPYSGIGLSREMGPQLSPGSPYAKFEDPGYYANKAALEELINNNLVYWLYNPMLRNTLRMVERAVTPAKVPMLNL